MEQLMKEMLFKDLNSFTSWLKNVTENVINPKEWGQQLVTAMQDNGTDAGLVSCDFDKGTCTVEAYTIQANLKKIHSEKSVEDWQFKVFYRLII